MLRLLKQMKAKQWIMALLCVALILGQIYFDLRLPDYMSDLTVQIKTPGSTVSDVLHTGLEMLACTLISAVMAIFCGYLNAQVAAGFSYHIRESVFQKVADFGQKEMLEFSVPSLINRTTNDITQIQMFVAMGMQTMIKACHGRVGGHKDRQQELDAVRDHGGLCRGAAGPDAHRGPRHSAAGQARAEADG